MNEEYDIFFIIYFYITNIDQINVILLCVTKGLFEHCHHVSPAVLLFDIKFINMFTFPLHSENCVVKSITNTGSCLFCFLCLK